MKIRTLLLVGVCAVALSGCNDNKAESEQPGARVDPPNVPNGQNVVAKPEKTPRPVLQRPIADPIAHSLIRATRVPLPWVKKDEPPTPATPIYELRIRGAKVTSYSSTLVGIRDVAVGMNGQRLPSDLFAIKPVDLANPAQAWLIAKFAAPADAEQLDIVVQFDDFGGYVAGSEAGSLDTRAPTLHFVAKLSSLKLRGRGVIEVDLSRSVVELAPGERAMVPSYVVNY